MGSNSLRAGQPVENFSQPWNSSKKSSPALKFFGKSSPALRFFGKITPRLDILQKSPPETARDQLGQPRAARRQLGRPRLPKPWKTMEIHDKAHVDSTKCVQMSANHSQVVFCTSMHYFQAVSCTFLAPSRVYSSFFPEF